MTAMQPLQQRHIDWLLKQGVTTDAMVRPSAILWDGNGALAFPADGIFWNVKTGQLLGDSWCLGDDLGSYDFIKPDWTLIIHETPLAWLQAKREGIVVVDWSKLYDRPHDIPAVSVPASLRAKYERHMRPQRVPKVTIRD